MPMTSMAALEELASYSPALLLRQRPALPGTTFAPLVARFPAALLIADLSGFTALTERLTNQRPTGIEELTQMLNLYFGHLVRVVTSHGGDVVKFAGDGLLALWYGDEPLPLLTQRAVQCGLAVQMMMAPDVWGSIEGSSRSPTLGMRVGVGAGEVTTMHLGGMFGRWELLVTGEALAQTGRAEIEAHAGEVVITAEAWSLVSATCVGQALPSGAMRLHSLLDYLDMQPLAPPVLVPAMTDMLRTYLPKAILARIDAGQTNWLAEQRRISVLFISLPDLRADTPLPSAQTMMHTLQSSLYRYEGSIARLGTDSSGPILVAALGLPPLAHEDDPERSVLAALTIVQALGEFGWRVAIGITSGRALCAVVGGLARREYTMMGAVVNRSARLMQAATSGLTPILVDEATFRAARSRLAFETLSALKLKGIAEPVPVFTPLLAAVPSPPQPAPNELLGREREQQVIANQIDQLATQGRGGTLIIDGEAGIGKSALLTYARAYALTLGLRPLVGASSPLESPPYQPWRAIFSSLIALLAPDTDQRPTSTEEGTSETLLTRSALAVLDELDLSAFAPLLGAVLPLKLDDTPRTAHMVGQVRADNTRALLVRLVEQASLRTPLLLVFEDAQWLDPSSWALLLAVAEHVSRLLLLIAIRPMSETPAAFQRLAYRPSSQRLQLQGLAPEAIRDLIARRLDNVALSEALWKLIAARAQGNPFVSEELLAAMRESGALRIVNGVYQLTASERAQLAAASSLPDTVEALITSRIDRLTPDQQLTLKVASVIGPVFTLADLAALHPVEHEPNRLVKQLFALQQSGLVLLEALEPELRYTFKHAVGSEVAYNLMSFAQRRGLHRQLAELYEQGRLKLSLSPAQLTAHWRQADEPD